MQLQRNVKANCRLRRESHCWVARSSQRSVVHQHPEETQQQLCARVLNKALVKAERAGRRLRSPAAVQPVPGGEHQQVKPLTIPC